MRSRYHCPLCGGAHVQVQVWADPNADYHVADKDRKEWANYSWCHDCNAEVELVARPEVPDGK